MTSNDLQRDQTDRLTAQAAQQLRWFNRLCERMQQCHFPPDDPLWIAAHNAPDVLQALHMTYHYAGCKSGAGRPEEGQQSP